MEITKLPEEVFQNIVKQLAPTDFQRCQKVCKDWYRLFHLQTLKNVRLADADSIEGFMNAIDANPDQVYLNAVRAIELNSGQDDWGCWGCYENDDTLLTRLFFRFRNLEKVEFFGQQSIAYQFNDALCQKFLDCCPKLDIFSVHFADMAGDEYYEPEQDVENYYNGLCNCRLILTHMDAVNEDWAQDFCTVDYVTKFPRLKGISDAERWFSNYYEWLSIFNDLPDYQSIDISSDEDINLAEDYVTNQPQEKQINLMGRLAKVREFRLHGVLEDAIAFALKHFTGLEVFSSNGNFAHNDLDELQIQCYFNKLWELAHTAKISRFVAFDGLSYEFISTYHNEISSKIFQTEKSKSINNDLHLRIEQPFTSSRKSNELTVQTKPAWRLMMITFKDGTTVNKLSSTFFKNQLDVVTALELEIKDRHKQETSSIDALYKILVNMPSLKALVMDVPTSYSDSGSMTEYLGLQMEELTIRANPDVNLEPLLNRFYHVFPKLKYLSTYYNCGTWNQDSGEFHLELPAYSLECLTVDLTAMKNKSQKHLSSQVPLNDYFFIVNVTNNDKRQMYQVPLDFSSLSKVNDDDLFGFECGLDFYQLNITIQNVRSLRLYINYSKYSPQDNPNYKNSGAFSNGENDSKTLVIESGHGE